jgi:hypothetical protein
MFCRVQFRIVRWQCRLEVRSGVKAFIGSHPRIGSKGGVVETPFDLGDSRPGRRTFLEAAGQCSQVRTHASLVIDIFPLAALAYGSFTAYSLNGVGSFPLLAPLR